MSQPDEHIVENRRHWNDDAPNWVDMGRRAWASPPSWGIWSIPETELGLLPDRLDGLDSIELGCGTGYVSCWLARRGARATAIDLSDAQLATAASLRREHGVDVRLVHGNAEQTPFRDQRFDFAISEYGAAIWCDPHVWLPEARRLLRPGGKLVIFGNHPLAMLCIPPDGGEVTPRLERTYFGLGRTDWRQVEVDPGGIEFNLPISGWLALFARLGFVVDRYVEVQAPPGADDGRFGVSRAWAERWPAEQAWILRLPPAESWPKPAR